MYAIRSYYAGDEGVATVSVDGTTLTINEVALGTTTVIVTATDLALASVNDTFDITINNVNDAPVVAAALADLSLDEHFISTTVDLSAVFTDADAGDVLTLSAVSGDEGVATVSVDGTTLTINEVALGTTTVIVTRITSYNVCYTKLLRYLVLILQVF